MIDLCTGWRRKRHSLASRLKLVQGGDRLSGAGIHEREHPDMGRFRGVNAAYSSTLYNLGCFGPDNHDWGTFVHLGGS